MKRITCLVAYIIITLIAAPTLSQEVVLDRREVIEKLSQNVSIKAGGLKGIDADGAAELLKHMREEIRRIGEQVLPDTLTFTNVDRMKMILQPGVIVDSSDASYNEARAEEVLRTVNVYVGFEKVAKPLSAEAQASLAENIKNLRDTMQVSMVNHLSNYYSVDDIVSVLDKIRDQRVKAIGDPGSYALRIPIGREEIAEIGREFDARLQESIKRVAAQFASADKIDDPIVRKKYQDVLKKAILMEVIGKGFSALCRRTSDPALASLSPDSFDPKYTETVKRRVEIERRLGADRKKEHEDEVKRAKKDLEKHKEMELARDVFDPRIERLGEESVSQGKTEQAQVAETDARSQGDIRTHGDGRTETANRLWFVTVIACALTVGGFIVYRKIRAGRRVKQ